MHNFQYVLILSFLLLPEVMIFKNKRTVQIKNECKILTAKNTMTDDSDGNPCGPNPLCFLCNLCHCLVGIFCCNTCEFGNEPCGNCCQNTCGRCCGCFRDK